MHFKLKKVVCEYLELFIFFNMICLEDFDSVCKFVSALFV